MKRFFHLFHAYFPQISLGWWLAILAFCAAVFLISWLRTRRLGRSAAFAALAGYAFFLLVMLAFARRTRGGQTTVYPPFYSYRKILEHSRGSFEWACLDIFNCLLFFPLGFLYMIWNDTGRNAIRHAVLRATAVGFALSLLAETLQLLLHRGAFEFDDILHNTIGTFLGALIGGVFSKISLRALFPGSRKET